MTTKLTLTVETVVIKKAKEYAKNTGRSLSELVGQYLEKVVSQNTPEVVSPGLKKIIGVVKLSKTFDEDRELRAYLEQKHL